MYLTTFCAWQCDVGVAWLSVLRARFELLPQGNFGTVWLAASRQDPSHQVAVKIVPKSRTDRSHEESLECIRREVSMWGCLSGDSRYVAELLGLYEDGHNVYLVQQLCQGGDLLEALKEGPLPEACCAAIMWCVLSAIRDCHDHDLALIDVKPQNFLLTAAAMSSGTGTGQDGGCGVRHLRLQDQMGPGPSGPCVVACDFGCSLSYTELMRGAKRAGSPVFFAPEQFTNNYGLVVDEWAAGIMLYLLLSGRYPFWDCKREELDKKLPAYQVMLAVCSAPIAFGGPEWYGISRDARDLLSQLLDRNPATRLTADRALRHSWFARWMKAAEANDGGDSSAKAKSADACGAVGQSPQRWRTTSSRSGTDDSTRRRRAQAVTVVKTVGCCGGTTDAIMAAQLGKPDLGPTLAGCCGGSNIVPLLASPVYMPLPVGATTGAPETMAVDVAGSDDEDSPGCSVAYYH
ncbi:hypothetical protein Vretifemale_8662 [Volvox reticuliferus]|uniref:Protein kinase domain-containing protein n=1 Tax=Volvox reticuliferus TaxID=1737510 RepID=A0A8J4CB14_9CHLO|nr:hypothetical protein Vretifemale_8662 [Volvox reticuliferus]